MKNAHSLAVHVAFKIADIARQPTVGKSLGRRFAQECNGLPDQFRHCLYSEVVDRAPKRCGTNWMIVVSVNLNPRIGATHRRF
jgi:hypothetical protein